MQTYKIIRLAFITTLSASLLACSVRGPRENPLPRTGPKMLDIYQQNLDDNNVGAFRDRLPLRPYNENANPPNGRSTVANPLNNRFARLLNPDLEMHVYPHMAAGKYPIPGYVTVFPMFESVQYAMPGEVAP